MHSVSCTIALSNLILVRIDIDRSCSWNFQKFNCFSFVLAEKEEWGLGYDNYSGYGLIGMIIGGRIHMALGGMYTL